MTKTFRKLIQRLLLICLILTPLYTISEQLYFYGLSNEIGNLTTFVKGIKDIIFLLIYICGIVSIIHTRKIAKSSIYWLLLILYIAFLGLFSPAFLPGLRWCHFFLLCCFLRRVPDDFFIRKYIYIFRLLFFVQITSQIFELFYMIPKEGYNSLGLASRCPGFFVYPSSAGIFAATNYLLFILFPIENKRIKNLTFVSIVASQIIAMSSTGVVVLLALFYFNRYSIKLGRLGFIMPMILIIPLVLSNLDFLSGRNAGANLESGGTRIQLISNVFNDMEIISTKFGLFTNTAVSLHIPGSEIADSTLTSSLGNLGLLGFLYLWLPVAILLFYSYLSKNKRKMLFFIWALGSSIPVVMFEMYPLNMTVAVLYNYLFYRHYPPKRISTSRSQKRKKLFPILLHGVSF